MPSYELAVVVDDAEMGITEVVRGGDLLLSTARQILLYEALGQMVPIFFHCPLMRDTEGRRMAKRDRDGSTTISGLRDAGWTPAKIREELFTFRL
jgi:glutamyl-tRNA synthetase